MIAVSVTWLTPAYEAALDDGPEWPPHPARLFCALVAAAREGSTDDEALRWLEAQAPPVVLAPESRSSELRAFVPTNAIESKRQTQLLGRTAGPRVWRRSHLASNCAHFLWEQSSADADTLGRLQDLARRVPFFGRSTSQAIVTVSDRTPPDGLVRYEPRPEEGEHPLRVPFRGYLDQLREAFEEGEPSRTVAPRRVFYGLPATGVERPVPVAAAYPTLLILAFPAGASLDGRLVVRITTAFRKSVLQRLGRDFDEQALSLVHGHHDGSRRQCAFLALPFVGHTHATGQILGVGLALSPDLDPALRRALLELCGLHLDRPGLTRLNIPGLASLDLEAVARASVTGGGRPRWSVRPERWTTSAQTWVSALPIVLDRYPDHIDEAAEFVARGCVMAGYPEPEVEHLAASAVAGAQRLRSNDLRRRQNDPPRPAVHARLTFPVSVTGPVVVGHLRHLGLGLCIPQGGDQEDQER